MLPPRPKLKPRSQPDHPWQFPKIEPADIFAIQAVAKGIANEGQQQRALAYILHALCETDRMTFWPGEDGRRATDFAEGKRWIGLQIKRIERLRPEMRDKLGEQG